MSLSDNIVDDSDMTIINGNNKIDNFFSLNLKQEIIDGICGMNIENPTKIQSYAIPILLDGKDLLMQSNSGSGKTLAFLISVLNKVNLNLQTCQAIIIVNTRELARQTVDVFDELTFDLDTATRCLCIPGFEGSCKTIFLIGTLGTIYKKLFESINKDIDPTLIKYLIIDEADVLLNDSNIDGVKQLKEIKKLLPNKIQTILVSATHPKSMEKYEPYFLNENYSKILIKEKMEVPSSIHQLYIKTKKDKRPEILYNVLKKLSESETIMLGQCIVFSNTKNDVSSLVDFLLKKNIPTSLLMSGDDSYRDKIFDDFIQFKIRFLITTDIMARGIDNLNVNFVVNYELPVNYDGKFNVTTYIHRIGRTGRIGLKGLCLSFVEESKTDNFIDECQKNGFIVDEFSEEYISQLPKIIQKNEENNRQLREKLKLTGTYNIM